VKQAWRKQCSEHHPDKGGDPAVFRKVMHAYKMLTDPSYRSDEVTSSVGRKDDLNMRLRVPVTFEQAFLGAEIVVTYNKFEIGEDLQPVIKEKVDVETLKVVIPPGTTMGHEVFFAGKGHYKGEKVGDLILQTLPREHPRFRVEGRDIVTEDLVDLDIMLRGGSLEIQTMWGLHTLVIPPGTQPSERLVIPKCGVSKLGKHFVVVRPRFPSRDELKSKEQWKGLDINWENHPEATQDEKNEQLFIQMGGYRINVTGG
jgi:DnaJ-class molecular chaperone